MRIGSFASLLPWIVVVAFAFAFAFAFAAFVFAFAAVAASLVVLEFHWMILTQHVYYYSK